MPRIANVEGVSIYIYADDHPPPHVHARMAGEDMMVDIVSGHVLRGDIPPAKKQAVLTWVGKHASELLDAWYALQAGRLPRRFT